MPTYLAIDVGTDRLAAGIVDDLGEVLVRDRVATPPRDMSLIATGVKRVTRGP